MTSTPVDDVLALDASEPTSRSKVFCWAMWDWGTQPFSSVIITFVFSVYLTSSAFGDINYTTSTLAKATTIAGVLVAVLAPVLGQSADRNGRTVRDWRIMTYALGILSGLLFFIAPHPNYLWPALVILAIGYVINEISGVNYNAMLDEVAGPGNVGKISGFGWGMGYLGGIVVLLILYFGLIKPDVGWFGVTSANGMDIRVSMLGCAAWILLFTIPTFLKLHDKPMPKVERENPWSHRQPTWLWVWLGPIAVAYRDLWRSLVRLWGTSRQTIWFLLASALFRDGLAGVFAFGAVIAAGTFGLTPAQVIIFGAAANILAGLSTMIFGLLDDRIGPRRIILISLGSLSVLGLAIFFFHSGGPMVFWVAGLGMTLFVGPAQAASRSYLARLIPTGRSGEIFGLYATTGRAISFLSPAFFGLAIWVGAKVTGLANTQYWGILGIFVVLIIGLIAMLAVKETGHGTDASTSTAAAPTAG